MSNAHDRQSVLQVSREDNLLVALRDLEKGEQVEWEDEVLTVAEDIPAKHKLATCQLSVGDPSYMYGVLVGEATKPIGQGQKINTDNLVHRSADYQQANPTGRWTPPSTEKWSKRLSMDFTGKTVRSARPIIGWSCRWSFAKMESVETLKNSMLEALGFERRNQYQRFARDLASVYSGGLIGIPFPCRMKTGTRPPPFSQSRRHQISQSRIGLRRNKRDFRGIVRIAGRLCMQSERWWCYDPKLGLSACPSFDHGRRNSETMPRIRQTSACLRTAKIPLRA